MAYNYDIIATYNDEQLQEKLIQERESLEAITIAIVNQYKEINKLTAEKAEMSILAKKAFNMRNDEEYVAYKRREAEIEKEINLIKQEQKEAIGLADEKGKYVDALEAEVEKRGQSAKSSESFRTQLRNLREEMMMLAAEGERGSERYAELAEETARLSMAQKAVAIDIQAAVDSFEDIGTEVGALNLAASGFEVYTGLVGQFASSTEEAEEMQTKLGSAIAIANGVQEITNQLERKSNLMRGISILQIKAKIAAQKLSNSTTWAGVVAQKTLNAVSMANPYVLLAVAIMSVVGAIALMAMNADKAVAKMDALNDANKRHAEHIERLRANRNVDFDDEIEGARRELELAKARNASLKEQRELEDKLAELQSKKANWNVGYVGVDDLEENKKKLDEYNNVLRELENNKGKKKIKIDVDLDGKVDKVKVEDAIKAVQERIDILGAKVQVQMEIQNDKEKTDHDRAVQLAERKEQDKKDAQDRAKEAKKRMDAERAILRAEADNRIALEKDASARESAQLKAKYDRAIEDLKYRLENEAGLTIKAKESLRRQIVQQEQLRNQAEEEMAKKRAKAVRAIEKEIAKNETDLMEEGLDKTLAQNLQAYKDRMDTLKERYEKQDISADQFATLQAQALAEYQKANKDALKSQIADFLSYEQEKLRIATEYQAKIDELYEKDENGNRTNTLRQGVTPENVAAIVKEMNKAMADLDTKKLQESSDYVRFFSANLTMSAEELRKVGSQIKQSLNDQLRAGTITIDEYTKAWDEVEDKIKQAENAATDFQNFMRGGLQGLYEAKKELAEQQLSAANEAIRKATEDYQAAKASGDDAAMATARTNMAAAEIQILVAKEQRDAANANLLTIDKLAKFAEDIRGYVDIMTQAYDSVKSVAESFGIDTDSAIFDYADMAVDTLSSAAGAFASFMVGDIAGGVKQTIQTIGNLIVGLNKANDAELQRSIEKHKKNVAGLQSQYDKLSNAISKSYSSKKAELIRREQELLRKQNEELAKAREEEERKRKTDKNVVEGLTKQIEENENKIEELKDAEIEAIFGEDVQAAINDLASALVDAWSNGEDAVKAWADASTDWVRKALQEQLKQYVKEQQYAERIRSKIREAMEGDRIIDPSEWREILDYSSQLAQEAQDSMGWMQDLFTQLDSASRNSQAKGIAQASQESVNELNGRMTAVQGHTYSISESTKLLVQNSSEILYHVMNINANTDNMRSDISNMKEDMAIMRRGMSDMQTNGIRLR